MRTLAWRSPLFVAIWHRASNLVQTSALVFAACSPSYLPHASFFMLLDGLLASVMTSTYLALVYYCCVGSGANFLATTGHSPWRRLPTGAGLSRAFSSWTCGDSQGRHETLTLRSDGFGPLASASGTRVSSIVRQTVVARENRRVALEVWTSIMVDGLQAGEYPCIITLLFGVQRT